MTPYLENIRLRAEILDAITELECSISEAERTTSIGIITDMLRHRKAALIEQLREVQDEIDGDAETHRPDYSAQKGP